MSRNPSLLATTTIDTAHRHSSRQSDDLPPDRVELLPNAPAQYARQKLAKHHPQFWSKLIAEVKPHASLYDRNHPHYRMITKNSPLWVKVAANMGLGVEVAKSKWQNLRDRLAKEHTRFGNRSDWEHYDEAAFLIPFIVFREENRRPEENTDYLASATLATSSSNAKTDQLTKRYPSLYDRNHRDYRKVKINSPRWVAIAAQTGLEVDKARSTWQSLRNRLALEHTTFGNQSNWVHYNEAAFLIPFIEYKKRKAGLREAATLDPSMLGEEPTRKYDSGTVELSAAMTIRACDGDSARCWLVPNVYQCENKEMPSDTTVVPLNSATNATQKHAHPTRAAAGAQTTQTSFSSRSNESSSSNSALMMNDERVSEKVGSVDNHADRKQYDTFATHDCTILRVPPNILLFGDNVQADSAQVTVFDCPPPSIPCIGELPKLKLFHDLSNSERAELEKAEGFETQCTFCDPKNKCTSGAPDHDQHFFDDGNCDLLYNHYALAHDPSLSR
ncbi:hypothetical protein AAVH_01122 [Aphelenchoides avenae]|nr:hypothetical protein AAVH_01122 [Aphelenchus avenae]